MLSEENYIILIEGIQEKTRTEGGDISNSADVLNILKLHWDELTDFASAATANNAAELRRLQAEKPIQETALQTINDRITALGG